MHGELHRAANTAGTFVLLSCGAEDTTTILTSLGGYQPVDTLVSMFTLCSVPKPQERIKSLVTEVLEPDRPFLFLEDVQKPSPDVAWWQPFWSPVFALDRPTHVWVQQLGGWANQELTRVDGEDEEHSYQHRVGKFVRRAWLEFV